MIARSDKHAPEQTGRRVIKRTHSVPLTPFQTGIVSAHR